MRVPFPVRSIVPLVFVAGLTWTLDAAPAQVQERIQIATPQQRPGMPVPPRDPRAEPKTGTAVIRGRVVSAENGQPLRRAQIRASAPEARLSRVTSTDAEGRFELKELPTGRFTLTASKGGYVMLQYGQRRPFEQGKPIEVTDGQALEKVDFVLPRAGVITGRIVDEFGEPLADAMVMAMRYQYFEGRRRLAPSGRTAQSNDIGQFRIFGLPPGDYYVSAAVRAMGFAGDSDDTTGYAPTYYPGTSNVAEAQRVTVNIGGEINNVDFALTPTKTARISGTAQDSQGRPLAGAFINVIQRQQGDFGTMMFSSSGGQVKPDGSFLISNISPGEYALSARTMDDRGEAEFASVPVSVAGEDITGLVIVTGRGGTLRGAIVTEAGSPPPFRPTEARVSATPTDMSMMPMGGGGSPRVQDDWTFEIKGLLGARLIRAQGAAGWSLKSVLMTGVDVTDTPIDFKGAEEITGVQIVLTNRPSELTGRVLDDRGRPVAEYTVVVFAEDNTRWKPQTRYIMTGRPDQEGRYRVRGLPPETYLAIALEYVQQGEWTDPAFLDQLRGRATRIIIGDGETKALDLKLTPST